MSNTKFASLAENTLSKIVDIIEEQDTAGLIDIDYNLDIITLVNERGTFILNKHAAAKEIWLSSPISGPHHFRYDQGSWHSKYNANLFNILSEELNIEFKQDH